MTICSESEYVTPTCGKHFGLEWSGRETLVVRLGGPRVWLGGLDGHVPALARDSSQSHHTSELS